MKHYLFKIISGKLEGEEFIVGADFIKEAQYIADGVAEDGRAIFIDELSEFEAEASGLDEY